MSQSTNHLQRPHRYLVNDTSQDLSAEKNALKYDKILGKTKTQLNHIIFTTMAYGIMKSCRSSIYVLYAKSDMSTHLSDSEIESILSVGFLIEAFWHGIVCIIYGVLSNTYGYDKLLFIQWLMHTIGVFLEAWTDSIYIFIIGTIISETAFYFIGVAYISWLAPHSTTTQYLAYFVLFYMIATLLGPFMAGIVSHFYSYRTAYYIAFIISVVSTIHCAIFMLNQQTKMEQIQLKAFQIPCNNDENIDNIKNSQNNSKNAQNTNNTKNTKNTKQTNSRNVMINIDNLDKKYRFPIVVHKYETTPNINATNHENENKDEDTDSDNDDEGVDVVTLVHSSETTQNGSARSKKDSNTTKQNDQANNGSELESESESEELRWYQCPKLGFSHWFMLNCALFINSCCIGCVFVGLVYYTTYLVEKLDQDVFIATIHIIWMTISFGSGNLIVQLWFDEKILKNCVKNKDTSLVYNKYFVVSIFCSIVAVLTGILYPLFQDPVEILWFYDCIGGMTLGGAMITSDILILEWQPTVLAGKISGIKAFVSNIIVGICMFCISILWNVANEFAFYMQAVIMFICFLCGISMFFCVTKININDKVATNSKIKYVSQSEVIKKNNKIEEKDQNEKKETQEKEPFV